MCGFCVKCSSNRDLDKEKPMGRTVCKLNQCTGCMACINICAKKAISIFDSLEAYDAIIDTDKCIECQQCIRLCPQNNPPDVRSPFLCVQGWSTNQNIRKQSSSGGFATAIISHFILSGGICFACAFINGEFEFIKIEKIEQVSLVNGSKYVKSNPKDVFTRIKKLLIAGIKVLFVGLPCQVGGCLNFVGKSLKNQLYTIDLICHGTPSPKMLESFLNQYHRSLTNVKNITFRKKGVFNIFCEGKRLPRAGMLDRYTYAFFRGVSYTENCFSCQYAGINRISDLTIGDAWGSELPDEEIQRGISVGICQTAKGQELLNMARLDLKDFDLDKARKANAQLNAPTPKPKQREKFVSGIKAGKTFNSAMFCCYPKFFIRQNIKQILLMLKVLQKRVD